LVDVNVNFVCCLKLLMELLLDLFSIAFSLPNACFCP
jgi:hypothetical protein